MDGHCLLGFAFELGAFGNFDQILIVRGALNFIHCIA